jgi:hypothetical protein
MTQCSPDSAEDRIADMIGYYLAAVVSGNNQPDMSGDPRKRIPAARRRHFDDSCRACAQAIAEVVRAPAQAVRSYLDPLEQARIFYLAVYEDEGSRWESNECKDVWVHKARDYERRRRELSPLAESQRSLGREVARLMDKHGLGPAKPQFWLDLEALTQPQAMPTSGAELGRWCYENPNLAARTIEGLRAAQPQTAPSGPCPYAEDGMECLLETHSFGPCLCANPVNVTPQEVRKAALEEAAVLMQRWSNEAADFKNDQRCIIQGNVCHAAAIAIRNLGKLESLSRPK